MNRLLPVVLALSVSASLAAGPRSEITSDNVIALMNEYRARRGVAPLTEDRRLTMAARDRMRHMEETAFWGHESPEGVSPFVWLRARAYEFRAAAENLAAGFETTPLLVAAWMESPGHRDNILSPDFEHCGIAIIEGATTGRASGKSIVVLFGAERPRALVRASPK